ncbi:MAG: PRC-barrel domain-containing protein [Thermodesulfobacteriota bacterium]
MSDRQRFEAKRREAMKIVGMDLRGQTGDEIGEVDNVIVTPDERVFAVLSVGGFWGIGDERVLVPLEDLRLTGNDYVIYPGTQEELEALPTFREGRARRYIRRNYRVENERDEETDTGAARGYVKEDEASKRERRESAEKAGQQRRQAQTAERQQEPREGDRMLSTLTFPAPEGKGAIVLEREGLQQVRAGESYDYTLRVSNDSDYPVHEVTIKEMLSDNIAVEGSKAREQEQDQEQSKGQQKSKDEEGRYLTQSKRSQQQKGQEEGRQESRLEEGKNKWSIGTLMPGETKKIEVSGVAQDEGTAKSCLVVDFKPSLCNEFQVVKPELELERNIVDAEGNPIDEAYACDDIYMVYKLTNSGTGTTRKATITEDFPKALKVEKDKEKVDLTLDRLDSGETVERRVSINADEQARYEGRATASTDQLEVKSDTDSIVIMKPELDVSIDGPREDYLGRPIQYHVRVENTSDAPALDTVVTLNSGDNLNNMSVSRQKMERDGNQFMIGKLEAGESREFSVSFDAEEPGKVTNTVTAKAYCAEEKSQEIATDILGIPAVRVEMIDRTDPVKVGDTTTYEIRVKNQGSAEDLNVSLNGTLPEEMEFVSGEGDTKVTGNGQNVKFAKVDSLPPGEVISWDVQAKATETGRTKFRLELTSDANKRPVVEMEPTTLF